MKRGDVVIVEIAYVEGAGGKKRPALVVQNDRDNRRLSNTVVAMISGNAGIPARRVSYWSIQLPRTELLPDCMGPRL